MSALESEVAGRSISHSTSSSMEEKVDSKYYTGYGKSLKALTAKNTSLRVKVVNLEGQSAGQNTASKICEKSSNRNV